MPFTHHTETAMFFKRTAPALAAALSLSACGTMIWYDHVNGASHTTETSRESDSIVAFGRTKPDSQTMPKDKLVMLGNWYIYVITESAVQGRQHTDDSRLVEILNVKLSRAFDVHEDLRHQTAPDFNAQNGGYFPITYDKDQNRFSGNFCLNYRENTALSAARRTAEQRTLDQLQFLKHPSGSRYLCMQVAGQVYAKPDNMNDQYRFETPVPVKLTVTRSAYDGGRLAKMATLPLAVAFDIVTLPIQLLGIGLLSNADW